MAQHTDEVMKFIQLLRVSILYSFVSVSGSQNNIIKKFAHFNVYYDMINFNDRPSGLVVRVPDYISRGPGSILGATRFSEKQWVWNGVHSA
jgi:hypothetical protein